MMDYSKSSRLGMVEEDLRTFLSQIGPLVISLFDRIEICVFSVGTISLQQEVTDTKQWGPVLICYMFMTANESGNH